MKTHRDKPIYDYNIVPRNNNVCNENWIYSEIASNNDSNTHSDDSYGNSHKLYFEEIQYYCEKSERIRIRIVIDKYSCDDNAILGNIGLNC